MARKMTAKQIEAVQDRSHAAWNRMVQREEDELRRAQEEAESRRSRMHVARPAKEA
jgi:hypothetical protein